MNTQIEFAAKFAYSFKETIYQTYESAQKMINENIEGDFVECGVAAGAQIAAMQVAIQEKSSAKKIFAFDSFIGIPMAGEFDTVQAGIGEITHNKFAPLSERLVSSGITSHSKECVIQNFNTMSLNLNNVVFVEGWFQDTLESASKQIESISILRLDGDLHESTLVCLEYLYPKVSKGGIVIIDDYALDGCRIAVHQYFDSIKEELPEITAVQGGGGVTFFYKK